MRFLLYLRAISLHYGYMVRMITGAVYGMVPFLMIFFFGICAFADAFESISTVLHIKGDIELTAADPDATFYEKYIKAYILTWQRSFLVALGEFDPNLEFYREIDWFVFFIFCIFNMIVLLNLLISIIGEIYGKYSAIRDATSFKEKVFMMSLMQDSVFGWFVKSKPDPTQLILVAKVIDKGETTQQEEMSEQISLLRDEMVQVKDDLMQAIKDNKAAA